MKSRNKILLAFLAFLALLASCTQSEVTDPTITSESTLTHFDFTIEEQWEGDATRAVTDDGTALTQLMNVWVLQYGADDALLTRTYYDAAFQSTDGILINSAANTLIFIANTFDSGLITDTNAATIDDLASVTMSIAEHDDVLGSDGTNQYCVMSGSITDYLTTMTGTVTLRRNCVKLNVEIANNISDEWSFYNVVTLNIPDESYIYTNRNDLDLDSAILPAEADLNTVDYQWSATEIAAAQADGGLNIYLPLNMRGTVAESTENKLRPTYAPTGSTAICVSLLSADATEMRKFTFYLGSNTTDDFNLKPNYSYDCDITIDYYGGNVDYDPRIELVDLSALYIYDENDISNCYILNPINDTQEFYIPIQGRINTFWGNQGYENSSSYMLSFNDDWYVDILWSDISGITHTYSNTLDYAVTSGGFTVQRVIVLSYKTPRGNIIEGGTALKVTLSSDFYDNSNKYGNVTVGIRNSSYSSGLNNYCWSWHFWITDYDPDGDRSTVTRTTANPEYVWDVPGGEVVKYTSGSSYAVWSNAYANKVMMDRPLGTISNLTYGTTSATKGFLYYQYGRKDPFPTYSTERTVSNGSTYYYRTSDSSSGSSSDAMSALVRSPTLFSGYYYPPYETSTKYKSTSIVWNDPKLDWTSGDYTVDEGKSIFDPSPLGWKVPGCYTWYLWYGMASNTNYYKFTSNQGAYFDVDGTGSGTSSYDAFYPATGTMYSGSATFTAGGASGFYWICSAQSTNNGYNMSFSSSAFSAYDIGNYRGDTRSVICIQE